MQDQLVCHGCRNTLIYPRRATNVRCALCNIINMVPLHPHPLPPHHDHGGMDMAHIVCGILCGGCRTMLMYTRGVSSVLHSPEKRSEHIACHPRLPVLYVAYTEGLIRVYNIHTHAVHYTLQREYMKRISRFSFWSYQ